MLWAAPEDPWLCFFIGIIACEVGKLVSKETKIDIIVTPAVTIITGGALAIVFAPCSSPSVMRWESLLAGLQIFSRF